MDQCENCGKLIGRLETPRVWNEHVVCADCHATLSANPEPPPPPHALVPRSGLAVQPTLHGVRTIEQTGKQWKLHMLIAAGLFCFGIVTMCAGCNVAVNGHGDTAGYTIGVGFLMMAGAIIYGVLAKAMAWWHHG